MMFFFCFLWFNNFFNLISIYRTVMSLRGLSRNLVVQWRTHSAGGSDSGESDSESDAEQEFMMHVRTRKRARARARSSSFVRCADAPRVPSTPPAGSNTIRSTK